MTDPQFLPNIIKQFQYYKLLGDQTFDQVSDEELFWQYNSESNSIAITAKHIAGNAISRWTDFLNSDGEKEWRNRDSEFEADIKNRQELIEKWKEGWACLFHALDTIDETNFHQTIYIRNMGHSIIEACQRQLAHYAYHVGQMIVMAKMMKGKDWQSLSIPRGKSQEFNKETFKIQKSNFK